MGSTFQTDAAMSLRNIKKLKFQQIHLKKCISKSNHTGDLDTTK